MTALNPVDPALRTFAVPICGPDGQRQLYRVEDLAEWILIGTVASRRTLADVLQFGATWEAAHHLASAVLHLVECCGLLRLDRQERLVITAAGREVLETMAADRGDGWRCLACGGAETRSIAETHGGRRRYVEVCRGCDRALELPPVRVGSS